MEYKFIVTGGGTSGHINPAITIADSLKKYYEEKGDSVDIIFTGRKEGLEGELVPKAGYEMKFIEAKPFPMKPSLKMLKALKALYVGRKQCKKIIKEFKPNAVIGTGGYVCAPLLAEAKALKIPVVIHEANAFPGRANRVMGRKADMVLTGFPDLDKDFKTAKKVVYTGNPIRSMFFGNDYESSRKKLGVAPDEKLVFTMGGSLGAKSLNDFIIECAKLPEFKDVTFVLSSGKQQTKLLKEIKDLPSNLKIMEYIDNPNDYLCGADISITRAGAVTCAETAAIGSCSIFVPYPHAAHDHQTFNAKAFEKVNGCVIVPDDENLKDNLLKSIRELLSDDKKRMSIRENAKKLQVSDCDKRIIESIKEVI